MAGLLLMAVLLLLRRRPLLHRDRDLV